MTTDQKQQTQVLDFEQSFRKLEQIVQEFEQGDLDLEHGLEKFKQAIALAKICKKRLAQVENKVIKIKQEFAEL
jgi:exodeoxyribonuclease VII small subunit